ncbi:MAG: hypothetical protein ACK520_06245 [Inhella sp.]|jgi:hypothetical protein|uniref:hypothetical protein n=1 Tax=Inhella sp. TaxID=1921806 RepID=UPI0022C784A2|nr:hypothetical protein [Inhella sp.]MCZ8236239.1 hypothetical protein [Inhella sp.]
MSLTPSSSTAPAAADPLTPLLTELESALGSVQAALSQRDALALERHAASVQRLMTDALREGRERGRGGDLTPALRQRLAAAGAQVAAQRAALGRATAALDRAIDVLMPPEPLGLYGQSGRTLRQRSSGDVASA